MRRPWNKGHTKHSHPSVRQIADTMRRRKIDNFAGWRKKQKEDGIILTSYPPLTKNEDLAFLIGMVLGDGHIYIHDRTESVRVTLGTDKPKLWKYTAAVMARVFNKEPTVRKVRNSECVTVTLYQKVLSERLGIPSGNRNNIQNALPKWIRAHRPFLVACIRGLFEAEGTFAVHRGTYTYKMIFSNRNDSLLKIVYTALVELGFHPHRSRYKVQISKKDEVYRFKKLIRFRTYT